MDSRLRGNDGNHLGLPRDNMKRFSERVRQEMDLAQQRPLEPIPPQQGVILPPAPTPSPEGASAPATFAAPPGASGLRQLLRGLPVLGGALAWANGLRDLAGTRRRLAEGLARLAELANRQAGFAAQQSEFTARQNAGQGEIERLRQEFAALAGHCERQRTQLMLLQHRLSRLPEVPAGPPSDRLDAFYMAFEDSFRGSPDEIKQRLLIYLGPLAAAGLKATGKPILDLGCGRGEWLELLREQNYPAYGIDLNGLNVSRGIESGLDMRREDAIGHLRGLADGSLAAVTAFHLIEHLPFETLIELVEQAHRALMPGGIMILESPSPENIQVGAYSFYNDPTHRHPIPASVARFMVENCGFPHPEVLRLNPCPETDRVADDSDLGRRFNQFFYGAQDYAVIGRKA